MLSVPFGRGERPEPGRSGRMQRNPAKLSSIAAKVFDVPPSPCTNTTGSPCPSTSRWMGPTAAAVMARLNEGVFQHANATDLDAGDVARQQVFRRLESDANARRRSRRDDVARLQRDSRRDRGDDGRDIEDQAARIGVLPKFAVNPALDRRVREIDLVSRHSPWAHWAERVLRFADQPLAIAALQVTRRDVVNDGIAPDVVERVFWKYTAAALADDNRKLRLVVHGLGDGAINTDRLAVRGHAFRNLG